MSDDPPYIRRLVLGLALGALVGAVAIHMELAGSRSDEHEFLERRLAVVQLQALAQALERVGSSGDSTRALVNGWDLSGPPVRVIRVLALEGSVLEASTAVEDVGPRAPPRRLGAEERLLDEQGRRLRDAVEANRREGAARKDEIETAPLPDGGLATAAPLERDGEVVAMVAIETVPSQGRAPGSPLLPLALAVLVPVLGLMIAARWVRSPGLLAVTGAVLLVGSLAALALQAALTLAEDQLRAEVQVVNATIREGTRAVSAVQAWTSPEALARRGSIEMGSFDVDASRRPLRKTPERTLDPELRDPRTASSLFAAMIAGASLAVYALVGTGAASGILRALSRRRPPRSAGSEST